MFTPATTPPRLATLIGLTALAILTLNLFLPTLPQIAADLQADYALVNLSVAGYLALTALLQLIAGPLSDRFGRRPVMLIALAGFCVASVGAALAESITAFLAWRVAQGSIIAGVALSRAIVRDMFDPQEATSKLGYISMIMAIAPMLGPILGGVVGEFYGWRGNFWIFAGFGAVMLWATWADLGETNAYKGRPMREQFQSYPELLRSRRFWGYALCLGFSVGAFYAFLGGAPLVATVVFDLSPAMQGVVIGFTTVGFFFGSFAAGRLGKRIPLTTMMLAGRLLSFGGMALGLAVMLAGFVTVPVLLASVVFVGLGNGLTLPSASAGVLSVRPELAGSASGLSGALMVGGGAVMTWATGHAVAAHPSAPLLLMMMLASILISLAAALWVIAVDRQIAAQSEA
ncbi:multidrug effflux MFS transporter [Pseudoruegeria sp. SHC-113]|uniref:multidrug effflux MFS transporter n=1 Tax=Pseudoruegeria sp. SHC-113 TaxID=2855439 RepID=UPI0021BA6376|nr:multidrug effflux MFS transporter [Pseudoruegeria sp. SHC-113]MCT8159825.1 multidrug effflux MFS transporter [Pseudoruegeria sp. SHC-113]